MLYKLHIQSYEINTKTDAESALHVATIKNRVCEGMTVPQAWRSGRVFWSKNKSL